MNGRRTAAFLALLVVAGLILTAAFTRRPTGPSARDRAAGNAVPADGSGPGPTLAGRRFGGKGHGPREARDPDKDPPPALIDAPFFVADERGLPIRGADVRVNSTSFTTDEQGHVLLRIPAGIGTYVLVDKEGYQRWTGSIDPESPETRIRLVRDLRSPLTVRLTGAEVADGVEVHVWLQSATDESVVEECLAPASAGAVAFEPRIEPGSYVVAASASGLVSGPAEVRVLAGVPAGVVVEMAPPRTIRGTVKDRRGASVQGGQAEWRQRPTGSCGQGLSARCDDEGRFVLTGVPNARVEVIASAAAFSTTRQPVDARQDEVHFVIQAYGTIEGAIDAADGGGIRGLRVMAEPTNGTIDDPGAEKTVPVHESGWFGLSLPEGDWRLRAGNGIAEGPESVVKIPPGGTVKATLAPPAPGRSIAGLVVDENGVLAEARIVLESRGEDGTGPSRYVVVDTDGEGHFEAARLPRGRYSVSARVQSVTRAWRTGVEAGTTDLRLALAATISFSVRLSGATETHSGYMVFYEADDGVSVAGIEILANGEVHPPPLPPGRYVVACAADALVAQSAEPGTLAPSDSGETTLELALAPGATITGVVRDAKGAARPGVAVEAHRVRLVWDKSATTDENGAFKFIGVLPGTWRLVVRDAEGLATHAATAVVEGANAYAVELTPVAK